MDFITFPLDPDLLPKWFFNPISQPNSNRENHLFKVQPSGIEGAGDGLFANCHIPPFALLEEYGGTWFAEPLIGTCTRRHTLSTSFERYIIDMEEKEITFMVPKNFVNEKNSLTRRVYLRKQNWESKWETLLSENLFRTEMHEEANEKGSYKETNFIEDDFLPLISVTVTCAIFVCPFVWDQKKKDAPIPGCWPMFANDVFVAKSCQDYPLWQKICEKAEVSEAKDYIEQKKRQWKQKATKQSKAYNFLSFSGCANALLLKLTFSPDDHPALQLKETVTRLFLCSLGKIPKHTEITVDYGHEYWLRGNDFWNLHKHRIVDHIRFVNIITEQIGLPVKKTYEKKKKRQRKEEGNIDQEVDIPNRKVALFQGQQKYVCAQWTTELSLARSLGVICQYTTSNQLENMNKLPNMIWLILVKEEVDLEDSSLVHSTPLFSYLPSPMTLITHSRLFFHSDQKKFVLETVIVKGEEDGLFRNMSLPSSTSSSPSIVIKQEPMEDVQIFVPTEKEQKQSIFLQGFKSWLRMEKSKSRATNLCKSSVQRYVNCVKFILQEFSIEQVKHLSVQTIVPEHQWAKDKRAKYNACVKLKEYLNKDS
jgi:hypothetical protein